MTTFAEKVQVEAEQSRWARNSDILQAKERVRPPRPSHGGEAVCEGKSMAKQWLKRLTVEQAEADNSPEGQDTSVPFGIKNSEWVRLVSKIRAGDQLYAFRESPPRHSKAFKHAIPTEGVALVRDGDVVAQVATRGR